MQCLVCSMSSPAIPLNISRSPLSLVLSISRLSPCLAADRRFVWSQDAFPSSDTRHGHCHSRTFTPNTPLPTLALQIQMHSCCAHSHTHSRAHAHAHLPHLHRRPRRAPPRSSAPHIPRDERQAALERGHLGRQIIDVHVIWRMWWRQMMARRREVGVVRLAGAVSAYARAAHQCRAAPGSRPGADPCTHTRGRRVIADGGPAHTRRVGLDGRLVVAPRADEACCRALFAREAVQLMSALSGKISNEPMRGAPTHAVVGDREEVADGISCRQLCLHMKYARCLSMRWWRRFFGVRKTFLHCSGGRKHSNWRQLCAPSTRPRTIFSPLCNLSRAIGSCVSV